jgi:hypothetical protein
MLTYNTHLIQCKSPQIALFIFMLWSPKHSPLRSTRLSSCHFTVNSNTRAANLSLANMPAAFTLYGNLNSTASNRVRLMLADANFTNYDFVMLNFQKSEQKVG